MARSGLIFPVPPPRWQIVSLFPDACTDMPIYAFHCNACGHEFDRLQKLSDPDPDACPACGQAAPRRLLSAPQFRLAGGGWYETDFKKDGEKKHNLADSGGAGDKAAAPEPAAKPAAAAAAPAAPASASE